MRHKKGNRKLGKPFDQRLALIRGQVDALFQHGRLTTTEARGKEVRRLAEKLITRAKRGGLNDLRYINRFLYTKRAYLNLKNEIVPAVGERKSGFVSLVRLGYRRGDGAKMVRLYLPDWQPPFTERKPREEEGEEEA